MDFQKNPSPGSLLTKFPSRVPGEHLEIRATEECAPGENPGQRESQSLSPCACSSLLMNLKISITPRPIGMHTESEIFCSSRPEREKFLLTSARELGYILDDDELEGERDR